MIEKYLTTEQVSELLQVHPFTILKYIKNGKLKGIKIGRVYRINESEVKNFLETITVNNKEEKELQEVEIKTKSKKKKHSSVNLKNINSEAKEEFKAETQNPEIIEEDEIINLKSEEGIIETENKIEGKISPNFEKETTYIEKEETSNEIYII